MDKWTQLRNQIDELDLQLTDLLAQRTQIVREIGKDKKKNNIEPLAQSRWEEVLNNVIKRTNEKNGNPFLIEEIYESIHKYALSEENNIMKNQQ